MRARGKHNWTASRKARLISMLTASTASQSVSRSNRQVTSSHLSSCAHFQDVAAIQVFLPVFVKGQFFLLHLACEVRCHPSVLNSQRISRSKRQASCFLISSVARVPLY